VNKADYVELGLACAGVCNALERGMRGRRMNELSRSVLEAIGELTTSVNPAETRFFAQPAYHTLNRRTVADIREGVVKLGKRNVAARLFHAKNDKGTIASWRLDLNRILHVFNVGSTGSIRRSLADPPSDGAGD
jgi:hypothetical protein